jgi:hypothetical protein
MNIVYHLMDMRLRKDRTHGMSERMVGMNIIYRFLEKSVRMNITVGSWTVRMDMPYRLPNTIVRMRKTQGLNKSTVRIDN